MALSLHQVKNLKIRAEIWLPLPPKYEDIGYDVEISRLVKIKVDAQKRLD